jgi:hypothetical protein
MPGIRIYFPPLVCMSARCDVCLHSDDRLYTNLLRGLVKLDDSVHISVVGQSQRVHIELSGADEKLVNFPQPVKQGVMRVHVEMGKVRHDDLCVNTCPEGKKRLSAAALAKAESGV